MAVRMIFAVIVVAGVGGLTAPGWAETRIIPSESAPAAPMEGVTVKSQPSAESKTPLPPAGSAALAPDAPGATFDPPTNRWSRWKNRISAWLQSGAAAAGQQ
jgi:hypothetical protein